MTDDNFSMRFDGDLDAVQAAWNRQIAEQPLDDILLAYLKYAPPRPISDTPIHFTPRQRFRIKRHRFNHAVQQWIHDHLPEAYCDD